MAELVKSILLENDERRDDIEMGDFEPAVTENDLEPEQQKEKELADNGKGIIEVIIVL